LVILVDTNVVVAALDPREKQHGVCREALLRPPEPLVIPAPTIPEIAYFLEQRLGQRSEAAFIRRLSGGSFLIEDPLPRDYARAADLVEQYSNFSLGTVDALMVAIAERLDVRRLLTLDRRHFGAVRPLHCDAFEIAP
jgi:predicted nucleic acid-binding protein